MVFYPATFFYQLFPFLNKLIFLKGDALIALNRFAIFLVFLILLDIMTARYIFSDSGYGASKFLRIAGYSLGAVILVMVLTHSVVNLDAWYNFSPNIDALFSADKIFYWNLAPVVLLFVL